MDFILCYGFYSTESLSMQSLESLFLCRLSMQSLERGNSCYSQEEVILAD